MHSHRFATPKRNAGMKGSSEHFHPQMLRYQLDLATDCPARAVHSPDICSVPSACTTKDC